MNEQIINNYPTERFVSLFGFFAFEYPKNWKSEVDESGNYIFYDNQNGSGVIRIIASKDRSRPVPSTLTTTPHIFLNRVLEAQKDYDAKEEIIADNRFISYVQVHDIDNTEYTVYNIVTAKDDKVVVISYTVQSLMKYLPVAEKEKQQLETLLQSFTFMHSDEHHTH